MSGPPSSGKTSLAHALAKEIPCPAVSRDEIKEGMVHAYGGVFEPAAGDLLTREAFPLFFEVLRLLLEARATVVAEAAFQDHLWRKGLEPLEDLAELKIVQLSVDPAVAQRRYHARGRRDAHAAIIGREVEDWSRLYESFDRLSLPAPSVDVDTTDGYTPSLDEIIDFVNGADQNG